MRVYFAKTLCRSKNYKSKIKINCIYVGNFLNFKYVKIFEMGIIVEFLLDFEFNFLFLNLKENKISN